MSQKQQLETAYSSILVTDPARGINVNPDIQYKAEPIREAFRRAALNEPVVDNNLGRALVDGPLVIYRSNPADETAYDFKQDIKPVLLAVRENVMAGKPYDQGLAGNIAGLAAKTGIEDDHVRARLMAYTETLRENEENVLPALESKFTTGSPATPTSRELVTLVEKSTKTGLTPEEMNRLQETKTAWAREQRWAPSLVETKTREVEDYIRSGDPYVEDFAEQMGDEILQTKTSPGAAHTPAHFTVPEYSGAQIDSLVAFGFNPDDLPGKPVPATLEQIEFLVALHEAEHTRMEKNPVTQGAATGEKAYLENPLAHEIDADSAVIAALNDLEQPELKEYWLQKRNISSFQDGLTLRAQKTENDFSHSTATFLRVYEQTGRQIDLDKFREEKTGLMDRLEKKLAPGERRMGNIMGAMSDILREDKTLSAVQKYEAEQFLRDGEALGYQANPDYPKPHPAAPAPVAAFNSTRPDAPGLG